MPRAIATRTPIVTHKPRIARFLLLSTQDFILSILPESEEVVEDDIASAGFAYGVDTLDGATRSLCDDVVVALIGDDFIEAISAVVLRAGRWDEVAEVDVLMFQL